MSGHSHAKTIKHAKELTDKKRGQMFSKMARVISVAVKEGGPNPETNNKLKVAMEQAKQFNLPKENIERAIKRGTGELEGAALEEFIYEAYGPGGAALIIEGVTDNKNRTLGEIKNILAKFGGKLAESGTVKWLFERKGVIEANFQFPIFNFQTEDEFQLFVIEAGAEDIEKHGDGTLDIFTKPEELESVKNKLRDKGIEVESGSLDWVAKNPIEVDETAKNQLNQLFETLDENEDVQEIYSNLKT